MKFTKMHGCGNDYVYINLFEESISNPENLAIKLSNRHFGIGGDGLILIAPSDKADAKMIMYNSDGSVAEMCGNGVRCVAKYVYDKNISRKAILNIETGAGIKEIEVFTKDGLVINAKVNMSLPILTPSEIPVNSTKEALVNEKLEIGGRLFYYTAVSMGNPHCIIYVDDVENFSVGKWGRLIENSDIFPKRTNVEFVQIISRNEVRQRTWERGSGETLACGTGASAVCVAGVLNDVTDNKIDNHLTGGTLQLEWAEKDAPVFMTGPCIEVFTGEIDV